MLSRPLCLALPLTTGDQHLRSNGSCGLEIRATLAPMYVLAFEVELRIPQSRSLKDKRQTIKPLLEGARRRFEVSSAEIDHQDEWQNATLGFAVVASEERLATEVIDEVDRFIWSFTEIQVGLTDRRWLE